MKKEEIEKYINIVKECDRTKESEAISCIRIETENCCEGKWIDIKTLDFKDITYNKHGSDYREKLRKQFRRIEYTVYNKLTNPIYPQRDEFEDEWVYRKVCHGITWETARRDISECMQRGIEGKEYTLSIKDRFENGKYVITNYEN